MIRCVRPLTQTRFSYRWILRGVSSDAFAEPARRFDLVVIGSGPSGQKGAISAAKMGKSVAIIDSKSMLGGVCVHTGTIPSKTFREAIIENTQHQTSPKLTATNILDRVRSVTISQTAIIENQLSRNNVRCYDGEATFVEKNIVKVHDHHSSRTEYIQGSKFLIACGTKPVRPEPWRHLFESGRHVVDSDTILDQSFCLPKEFVVVGAGVIGIEYASMINAIPGTRVTIVDSREKLLPYVDRDIVGALVFAMRRQGAVFRFGERAKDLFVDEDAHPSPRVRLDLESGKRINGDCLLYAVGRSGNVETLGLDVAGVNVNKRGLVEVDAHFKTSADHVYAVGDVIGFPALASTSMEQGRLASMFMFEPESSRVIDHSILPYGIYTIPEISMVGKTELELTKENVAYEVGVAKFEELARGQMMNTKDGFLKLIFHAEAPHKLLGVSAIGQNASEIIHIGQAVLAFGGNLCYFRDATFNFPTYAEAYRIAALDGFNRCR